MLHVFVMLLWCTSQSHFEALLFSRHKAGTKVVQGLAVDRVCWFTHSSFLAGAPATFGARLLTAAASGSAPDEPGDKGYSQPLIHAALGMKLMVK